MAGGGKREEKEKKKREAEEDAGNVASNPTDLLRWFEARTASELNLFAVSPPPRSPPTLACLSSSSRWSGLLSGPRRDVPRLQPRRPSFVGATSHPPKTRPPPPPYGQFFSSASSWQLPHCGANFSRRPQRGRLRTGGRRRPRCQFSAARSVPGVNCSMCSGTG